MTKRLVVLAVASAALAFGWSGCSGGSGSGGTGGGSGTGGSGHTGGGSAGGGSHTGGGSAGGGSAGGGSAGGGSAGGGSAGGGSAGGGSAGGGSAGGGPDGGALNGCNSLLTCVGNCADNTCFNACLADSTQHAQDLLNTLGDCINNNCFVAPDAGAGVDAGMPPCTNATQNSQPCMDCYNAIFASGGACVPARDACQADTP
jgi:hypothetical protein